PTLKLLALSPQQDTSVLVLLMILLPTRSTLFPYTTLFRSLVDPPGDRPGHRRQGAHDPAAVAPHGHAGHAVEGLVRPAQVAGARAHRRGAGRGDRHPARQGRDRPPGGARPRLAVGRRRRGRGPRARRPARGPDDGGA